MWFAEANASRGRHANSLFFNLDNDGKRRDDLFVNASLHTYALEKIRECSK